MLPYFYVTKIDLLTGFRSVVCGSFFLDKVLLFVRDRTELMKLYGFTYRYLIKLYYV